jgi:hypothetical protein
LHGVGGVVVGQSLSDFVETAILRDAVGPEIEFFDQAQMLVKCHVASKSTTSEMRFATAVPVPVKASVRFA